MNSSTPRLKICVLDQELNKHNIYLFIIMFILSLILTILRGYYPAMTFTFMKFIILFCAIIPIDLRINLDVSKTWFSYIISKDKTIP